MDNKNLNEIPEEKLEDVAGGFVPIPYLGVVKGTKQDDEMIIGYTDKEIDEMIIKAADSENQ